MTPAELLADHQRKPRNIGKLLNAHAVGDVGSIVVGDALRFYIQVADGRISAARFQVFNCQDQMAAGSVVTELALGLTLDQARALGPDAVRRHLGGLPVDALPPRLWALEALRVAVDTWRAVPAQDHPDHAALLCRCHGIPEETVRQSIAVMGLETVEQVVAATGAGSGCGSCKADIPRLIDEVRNRAAEPAPGAPRQDAARGRIGLVRRIAQAVDGRFLPRLRERGMAVELVDLRERQVVVRLSGGDEAARREALADLEAFLRAEIDPGLGVALPE